MSKLFWPVANLDAAMKLFSLSTVTLFLIGMIAANIVCRVAGQTLEPRSILLPVGVYLAILVTR
jgi:hypothetical protein